MTVFCGWEEKGNDNGVVAERALCIPPIAKCAMDGAPGLLCVGKGFSVFGKSLRCGSSVFGKVFGVGKVFCVWKVLYVGKAFCVGEGLCMWGKTGWEKR